MEKNNVTSIFLLGFPGLHNFRFFLFFLLTLIYLTTLCGNFLVITLVSYSKNLHCPMYFFLTQLTTSDIILSSDIVPNMLQVILDNGSSISLPACIAQLFFFAYSEASECFLLTVMSYDRYLAICQPLHYDLIMTSMVCLKLIIFSWILGFSVALAQSVNISQLYFCRSNVIDHFFCEIDPILDLSCSSVFYIKVLALVLCFPVLVCPFLIVAISYVYIVFTILRLQSITQRQKAFTTCGSHLLVVSIFYGALFSIYLIPETGQSTAIRKIFSIVYTVVTPLVNPLIYSLRNKDIKETIMKLFSS
ncbi:olfactory receptor 11L1-like [Bufo bufo]|uniref:olfactory receptor 11L1-like n=1 Tax=Bufo bufo TaxID=8384 RepID=UPI001ABE907D|nr:olfactory receptor 11L1-like [Bufo bufo]